MGKRRLRLPRIAAAAANLLVLSAGLNAQELPFRPQLPEAPAIRLEAPPAATELKPAAPGATGNADSAAIRIIVEDVLKQRDAEAKKKEADKKAADEAKKKEEEAKGVVVGDDRKLNVTIDNGGFRYKSADSVFNIHFGGRLMYDGVWFSQSTALRAGPAQIDGLPARTGVGPGIGNLQDGFFIRRARIVADGTFYENIEFRTEFDLENYNNLAFDEMYIGAKNLPFFDTIRLGHVHVPFGLEAYSSSRWLSTLERSPVFDAFYNEFAPGIFFSRTFLDQRVTTQHLFHRIDNFSQFNGDSFGDGRYAYSGRVSALPFYEDDGRELVHLALDYQWRKGGTPADFNGGTAVIGPPTPAALAANSDLFRFRTRQSLRDAVGAQGNGNRIVDTGNIVASHANSLNPELLVYWGRFWVQTEACWSHVSDAVFPDSPAATRRGDLDFWGAYFMCGVFLTGENRGYDRRMGKLDRNVPLENFFLVRGEDGRAHAGLGAWELVYRFGYDDLTSGTTAGLPVQGGKYNEHTFGVNWYWTPNIKWQFNYIAGFRDVPAPASNGFVHGIGLRGALEF